MSTPRAKRALNMGTSPYAKRARYTRTTTRSVGRVYGSKPEMKDYNLAISHAATTASDYQVNEIANGANEAQRVGTKIKQWNIECLLVSSLPVRIDLYMPHDPTTTVAHSYSQQLDTESLTKLGTYFFSPKTSGTDEGFHFFHRLPLGVVTKFTGTAGNTAVKNLIQARVTTTANTTVGGYIRIWYTDV